MVLGWMQGEGTRSMNKPHPSAQEVAKMVLDRYADSQFNISSEVGRQMIADELGDEFTHLIRNRWKEDMNEKYQPKYNGKKYDFNQ